MSPFGAIVSQRGYLKFGANTLMRKPSGTVGRNPAGGFSRRGPLPADLVSNGAGSFGFCPCVTCACRRTVNNELKRKSKAIFARGTMASLRIDIFCCVLLDALGSGSVPFRRIFARIVNLAQVKEQKETS